MLFSSDTSPRTLTPDLPSRPPTPSRSPRTPALGLAMAALAALAALPAPAADRPLLQPRFAAPVMQVPLPVLVELATGWVAADLGLPMPPDLPRVAFAEEATMRVIRAAAGGDADAAAPHTETLGLYDARSATIFLPLGWTGRSTVEVSILVHEIVHHFQATSGERFACHAAREKQAYAVQGRWLEARGESLAQALDLDPMFLLVATNCMY